MESLIRANLHFLDQAGRLLTAIEDPDYADPEGRVFESSLGQHLRHCLDHYASLLRGLPSLKVDYDHRVRDPDLERSTECALAELARLKGGLLSMAELDTTTQVQVLMDCGGGDQGWHSSTLGRELQFVVSHTVHHFAMMNGMCRERGITLEEGFGIAPSTLRHRELASIG